MKTDWKAFGALIIILYVFTYAGLWWGLVSLVIGVVALGWKDRHKGPFNTNQSDIMNQDSGDGCDNENVENENKVKEPTLDELDWVPLPYERSFSDDEYVKLKEGYIGKDMDSKWSLYFNEESDYIMERSWTKTPVFKLHFSGNVASSAETKFPLETEEQHKYYANMIDEVLDIFFEGVWGEQ